MNFQQLRSVREAVRCGFNLTEVSTMLFTSQPGENCKKCESVPGAPPTAS